MNRLIHKNSPQKPDQELLGDEAKHTKTQGDKDHYGAKLSRSGFPGQPVHNVHHVQDQTDQTDRQGNGNKCFFSHG